ncbi:hypothetical protein D9M70_545040 [compost metagenome]
MTAGNCPRQCFLIDEAAARGVDHVCAKLHPSEALVVEEVSRLCREWAVQADDIRACEDLLNRARPGDPGLCEGGIVRERIVCTDTDAECLRKHRRMAGNCSEADEPHGHARKFFAGEAWLLPPARS